MKKISCLVPFSIPIAFLLMGGIGSLMFISPSRASASTIHSASANVAWRRRPSRYQPYGAPRIHNQYFCGRGDSGNVTRSVGHNQANTGNQGLNRGVAQDNGTNGGNQVINRHEPRGYEISNQYFCGDGNDDNTAIARGYSQNNTGNEGENWGVAQDNSFNGGNQIVN